MTWWYGRFRGLIARGYDPKPGGPPPADWVVPPPDGVRRGWLLVFCPTILAPGNAAAQARAVANIANELARAFLPPALVLVGLQHAPAERGAAIARLQSLEEELRRSATPFAAFCMPEFGKVKSINVALDLALELGVTGVLQVDDDVTFAPGTFERLHDAYVRAGRHLAVGASKVGVARSDATSRTLRWLKGRTRPAVNYPHACCLLVDPAILAPGIPPRYVSDDGYICFKLLDAESPDPFRRLRLVEGARCVHYVGGGRRQSVRRIRRMLLNHHVYLADFPLDVSRFYFREILFPGLWPLASRPERFRALDWTLQFLYFLWFASVGLELAVRGLCGRPLREIAWAGAEDRRAPPGLAA
jgi:hypothetical protein